MDGGAGETILHVEDLSTDSHTSSHIPLEARSGEHKKHR